MQNKDLIVASIPLAAIALWSLLIFLPMHQSINFERTKITQFTEQNAQLNKKISLLQTVTTQKAIITQQIASLYADHKSLNEEINYLIGCINKNSLCCCNIKPIKHKPSKTIALTKNYIQFDLSGNFKHIFCFLSELEKSTRLLKISSCHIEHANNGHKINLQIIVKLVTEC